METGDLVAGLYGFAGVGEIRERKDAFGLEADIDQDRIRSHGHHRAFEPAAFLAGCGSASARTAKEYRRTIRRTRCWFGNPDRQTGPDPAYLGWT